MKKQFNGHTLPTNLVVLFFVATFILMLGVVWLLQMLLMMVILPKDKQFKWYSKSTWSQREFPGLVCYILCNAQITFAGQILKFRNNFETEWCTVK